MYFSLSLFLKYTRLNYVIRMVYIAWIFYRLSWKEISWLNDQKREEEEEAEQISLMKLNEIASMNCLVTLLCSLHDFFGRTPKRFA